MNTSAILILATVLCGLCACQAAPSTTVAPGDSSEVISVNGQLQVPSIQAIWNQMEALLPPNVLGNIIKNTPAWNLTRAGVENAYTQLLNMRTFNARMVESFMNRMRDFIRDIIRRIQEFMPKASVGVAMRRQRRSILTAPVETVESTASNVMNAVTTQATATSMKMLQVVASMMTSTIIPWLHELLDKAAATGNLPPNMVSMIQTLDTIYTLMHAMNLVG